MQVGGFRGIVKQLSLLWLRQNNNNLLSQSAGEHACKVRAPDTVVPIATNLTK